jgi:two-component system sensor histidine kinase RpfC
MSPSPAPAAESKECALRATVLAQARLRVKLGVPVWTLMLMSIAIWGPASPAVAPASIATAFVASMLYNFAALTLARQPRVEASVLARLTAVLDPLALSAGLALTGEPGQAFVGFYLFTILGFGFRIGPTTMRLCQFTALIGFSLVALLNPYWRSHPISGLSILILLIAVPAYAQVLIGRLREAQALAESESRAKSQLLANVSHELRTPLTGIMSSAQLLREARCDPEVQRRCDAILALSRDLMLQINDLLDSARHEAGALRLEPAPFSLRELGEQLRATLAPTAMAKGIALHIDVDVRIPEALSGDAHYLKRVLLNIAGNAVKFTEQGGVRLRIELIDRENECCLLHFCCRDTGIGIARELQQKIFEPFFQASSGITRKYGGTGLGMSIAREIVALMGGALRVSSEPGIGSMFEFTLRLPLAQAAVDEESVIPVPVPGKRILVADDNATNLMLLRETLERDRHQVSIARNGREALDALSSADFDLVLLDYNMADMDGATVLKLYRFGRIDAAPVYILTADVTAAQRLEDSGAAGVLHKPISMELLRKAVATAAPGACAAAMVNGDADVDEAALRQIREVSADPAFLEGVLTTAASDIERITTALLRALDDGDIDAVHDSAHALRGVCVSTGAGRLAAYAMRLMHIGKEAAVQDAETLRAELAELSGRGIRALQRLRASSDS